MCDWSIAVNIFKRVTNCDSIFLNNKIFSKMCNCDDVNTNTQKQRVQKMLQADAEILQ